MGRGWLRESGHEELRVRPTSGGVRQLHLRRVQAIPRLGLGFGFGFGFGFRLGFGLGLRFADPSPDPNPNWGGIGGRLVRAS